MSRIIIIIAALVLALATLAAQNETPAFSPSRSIPVLLIGPDDGEDAYEQDDLRRLQADLEVQNRS